MLNLYETKYNQVPNKPGYINIKMKMRYIRHCKVFWNATTL